MDLVEAPEQRHRMEQSMLRIAAQIDQHHAYQQRRPRRQWEAVEQTPALLLCHCRQRDRNQGQAEAGHHGPERGERELVEPALTEGQGEWAPRQVCFPNRGAGERPEQQVRRPLCLVGEQPIRHVHQSAESSDPTSRRIGLPRLFPPLANRHSDGRYRADREQFEHARLRERRGLYGIRRARYDCQQRNSEHRSHIHRFPLFRIADDLSKSHPGLDAPFGQRDPPESALLQYHDRQSTKEQVEDAAAHDQSNNRVSEILRVYTAGCALNRVSGGSDCKLLRQTSISIARVGQRVIRVRD